MKHLTKFFEFLNVDSSKLKQASMKLRDVLHNHYGIGLNVMGEFYYSDDLLLLCGEELNKNWVFYCNLVGASPDILKRGKFGVYLYHNDHVKVAELLEVLKIAEGQND